MTQISADLFRCGGKQLNRWIQNLLEKIWAQEKLPQNWTKSVLLAVYKK